MCSFLSLGFGVLGSLAESMSDVEDFVPNV